MFFDSSDLCCIVEEVNSCLLILRKRHMMLFTPEAMGGFKCASLAGLPPIEADAAHHATSNHHHFCSICWSTEWKSLGYLWSQSETRSRNALLMHDPEWCLLTALMTCWLMSALAMITQLEVVWCEMEWSPGIHESMRGGFLWLVL